MITPSAITAVWRAQRKDLEESGDVEALAAFDAESNWQESSRNKGYAEPNGKHYGNNYRKEWGHWPRPRKVVQDGE